MLKKILSVQRNLVAQFAGQKTGVKPTNTIAFTFMDQPRDLTNSWIESSIYEVLHKCLSNIDTKDKTLLTLYRFVALKYRMLHTLKSHHKQQLVMESDIRMLLEMYIAEVALCYFSKGNVDRICMEGLN